jgi:hypothetical protein
MSYDEYTARDRRLVILIVLSKLSERRANQYVMRSALRDQGYDELVPTVVNDLAFLRKQGLVTIEELPSDMLLATITDLGDQAARGVVRIQGVAVPAV